MVYRNDFRAPGVNTFVVHGTGIPTLSTMKYKSENLLDVDGIEYDTEDGDRVIPLRATKYASKWKNE